MSGISTTQPFSQTRLPKTVGATELLLRFFVLAAACITTAASVNTAAAAKAEETTSDSTFVSDVRPILKRYCFDCHSEDTTEADIDLAVYRTLADIRAQLPVWIRIRSLVESSQMPPRDSLQPTDVERATLRSWVRAFLATEARAQSGDPGPVVLRRLNNEEYNYSIQDLTGVSSLTPAREFPVDGAAGEGFINSGAAQAMSAALAQKYLDAAKQTAEHLVLLPDGITFSAYTSRRDQTDEYVGRIQAFYRKFTADGGGQAVDLQGIEFDTNQGGLLPLERYLLATLEERDALAAGTRSIRDVARERRLSHKYLASLWAMLTTPRHSPSFLLDKVRERWVETTPANVGPLTDYVYALQEPLWKFNSVGHIGDDGEPRTWMEPRNPIVTGRDFSLPLSGIEGDVEVSFVAADAGDGNERDSVIWRNPRLTGRGHDIPLNRAAGLSKEIPRIRKRELERTASYLAAAHEAAAASTDLNDRLPSLAARHNVSATVLQAWLDFLGLSEPGTVRVAGRFEETHTNSEFAFVSGWGSPSTPSFSSNSSDHEVRIPGIARPHSIVVHPSTTHFVAAGWSSPVTGQVTIEARLADVHPECGNGQEWIVQHRSADTSRRLNQGIIGTGGSAQMSPKTMTVRTGDLISLIIGPYAANHGCDLTEINLSITEVDGQQRLWDLSKDVSGDILSANPHRDTHGNARIWHFYQGEMTAIEADNPTSRSVPPNSVLTLWQAENDPDRKAQLAERVQALVTRDAPTDPSSADGILFRQIRELVSPLRRLDEILPRAAVDARFDHAGEETNDLIVDAPSVDTFRIPAELAAGRTLVTRGRLHPLSDGSVRLDINLNSHGPDTIRPDSPIVVSESGDMRHRIEEALNDFRELFAPAVCYARIVPVDEVVTITLFYRQDNLLQRLMLEHEQTAHLNRLWDQLTYVSQEPIKYLVAFEQNRAFATQDRPDLVEKWAPLGEAVERRASAFEQQIRDSEPLHVDTVVAFADRAWRRTLTDAERSGIRSFYDELREADLPHEESIRLTVARILASPAYLYRLEQPGKGKHAVAVSSAELAVRLSYFLWSSTPDADLRNAAAGGQLIGDETLLRETRRMLADPRTRRLAVQFACQWLHLRDFDRNDDKNETLYPQFAELRSDMYEETVLFFDDMFRNNGSVLNLLDADHTFLNASLASHYDIEGLAGDEWQRVTQIRSNQRGGILGMATVLASQSGASRTSPILRGNWISETLLGERLPRPPANVPVLPEVVPDGLTARELIEQHSSVAECAKCHAKIDPYGFALEQYDAIGRLRGDPVDTRTTLIDGRTIEGIDGLRNYLLTVRRDDVVRQFCTKLLGFALGREIRLSDEPLIDTMMHRLKTDEYRFHSAVEAVVLSPQFRRIRGTDGPKERSAIGEQE